MSLKHETVRKNTITINLSLQ